MQQPLTIKELNAQVADVQTRHPRLKDHEAFIVWFLMATLTEDEGQAIEALTGVSGDKGVDAVHIDDRAKVVFVTQSKYRKALNKGNESRSDVVSFAQLAVDLQGSDSEFKSLSKDIDPRVYQRLATGRGCLMKRGYRLKLYYVTLGSCAKSLVSEAERICRRAARTSSIDIVDGKKVLLALRDYLDGVAPPVPSLDLPMEVGKGIKSESHRRYDSRNSVTSWIFSMNAGAVAEMYEQAGDRLFARNIRGFLGNTDINKGMVDTIENEPWNFWYYNNGITMVCDHAERVSVGGQDMIRVNNPQVINGQQTTRTLHGAGAANPSASVQVRAIEVPRDPSGNSDDFDVLVSKIVAATNWQNEIRASDLMANDRRQVELERELRKYDYCYIRKRQSKSEKRRLVSAKYRFVTKEEIAQAVAACELDPAIVRMGKEGLFEEQFYALVYPTTDPLFFLIRYRLMKEVGYCSKGFPERAYAKWLVLHFVWEQQSDLMRSRRRMDVFRECSERNEHPTGYLSEGINSIFRASLAFYRSLKGKGEKAIDVSSFFRRRGLPTEFGSYLQGPGKAFLRTFKKKQALFEKEIKLIAETGAA